VPEPRLRLVDVLTAAAGELVAAIEADACSISRMIGDVLIIVAEAAAGGRTLQSGQGYLVSDFPETARVLTTRCVTALTLADPDADEGEASVLRELGFASLLMLPLERDGEIWGLVEIYRVEPRPFTAGEQHAASALVARLA